MSQSALRAHFQQWMRDNPPGMQKYGIADLHKLTSQALDQLDEMARLLIRSQNALIAIRNSLEEIGPSDYLLQDISNAFARYHGKEKPPGEGG